jgi:cellulose synthase operon protein C
MRLALFYSLVIIASGAALGQTPPTQRPAPAMDQDAATERFRLADAYLRAQQFDRAIALLEDLLADTPESFPVFDRLKDALLSAGRTDDAVRLIEDRIARTGPTTVLLAQLGSVHFGAGRSAEADRAWANAVEVAPDNVQTYRTLYSIFVQNRLWERGRDMLLLGRQRLRQNDLFRIELAELYSRSNQHAEALREWASLLAVEPNRLSFVQTRISRMLDQDGAATAFRESLDRLIRQDPMQMAYRRLAGWLAAETGAFDEGLDHMRAIDRLGRESGESLYAYAESAMQAGSLDVAQRAFELVIEQHREGPAVAASLFASAQLHEQRARRAREPAERQDSALEAASRYLRFIEGHAMHPAAPAAMHRLAHLHRDIFRDYEAAEALLERILGLGDEETAADARLALGELAILRDDLVRARLAFARIDNQIRIGERAERARLELALLDFYEGNFEIALARANSMKRNTATNVSNNAIDLKLILSENQGPDSLSTPLRLFAAAELRLRQSRPADALAGLDALLTSYAGHPITPLARFRRAGALRDLGRADDALAVYERLPSDFPDSYLADRALFAFAEVHEQDLGDIEAAIRAYTALLARFPGSLLAPEARARIRRLRGDRPA